MKNPRYAFVRRVARASGVLAMYGGSAVIALSLVVAGASAGPIREIAHATTAAMTDAIVALMSTAQAII